MDGEKAANETGFFLRSSLMERQPRNLKKRVPELLSI